MVWYYEARYFYLSVDKAIKLFWVYPDLVNFSLIA